MDEAEVVRINVPGKKPADITIDLRQDGLMHLFTVDSMKRLDNSDSPNDYCGYYSERPLVGESDVNTCNGDNTADASSSLPSTIIHLKIVPSEVSKLDKEETNSGTSSVCGDKISSSSSSESHTNKNCLRVRTSLCEMHKEKGTPGSSHLKDEQTNILKEFEISKQLERLRTETKKVVRRKYMRHVGRPANHNRHHSLKSEASDKSNNILSIFNDAVCEATDPAVLSNNVKSNNNIPTKRSEPLDSLIREEAGSQAAETADHLPSPKRKNSLLIGPRSKKLKFIEEENEEEQSLTCFPESEFESNQRCWLTFTCHNPRIYQNSQKISREDETLGSPRKEISLLVRRTEDEGEDLSQIGSESLRLWRLNNEEIAELKKQVKEEWEHKQREHIMPLILSMSPDQIESTYVGVKDVMKMYNITEPDSDEESRQSSESLEEESKTIELKSLDAIYKEEFSKEYYRDLFKTSEGDPFWKSEDDQPEDIQTNYSRSRPKRSTVDYSPSAYAFIGFMEGRRLKYKSRGDRRQNPNKLDGSSHRGTSSGDDLVSDCDRSLNSCDESVNSKRKLELGTTLEIKCANNKSDDEAKSDGKEGGIPGTDLENRTRSTLCHDPNASRNDEVGGGVADMSHPGTVNGSLEISKVVDHPDHIDQPASITVLNSKDSDKSNDIDSHVADASMPDSSCGNTLPLLKNQFKDCHSSQSQHEDVTDNRCNPDPLAVS